MFATISLPLTPADAARLPKTLPDPYTSAPSLWAQKAKAEFLAKGVLPENFIGRVGLMLTTNGSDLTAEVALGEVNADTLTPWVATSAERIWPKVEDKDVMAMDFVNGHGEAKSLRTLIAEVFAPFPDRPEENGGREQRIRRAMWRGFLTDGATDPCIRLLNALNIRNAQSPSLQRRVVALVEWWMGDITPLSTWDIRHDGSFCSPKAGARELFAWMLQGVPHDEPTPQMNDETLPALPVLYEDEHLIVVDKPARLASVPGGSESVSAKSILEAHYGELFVIHRLDMGTSGVLAFAKTKEALRPLNKAFSERTAKKTYLARLEGVTEKTTGVIKLPIALNWFDRPKQCILPETEGGREAVTDFEVIETVDTPTGRKSIVALHPRTGRTHQLRMHCAHPDGLGLPIDGDPFYGHGGMLEETRERRLCLHASELTIIHPMTGETITVKAPCRFPVF